MIVRTFADLLEGHERAEIRCLYQNTLVRRISKDVRGAIVLEPMSGPTLVVPATTPILHEPWAMDRGSLIFKHHDVPGQPLKLCGAGDEIRFEDDHREAILPAHDLPEHPHQVIMRVHGDGIPL
jgi:hypothetical protein